jgi:hypothetical protein
LRFTKKLERINNNQACRNKARNNDSMSLYLFFIAVIFIGELLKQCERYCKIFPPEEAQGSQKKKKESFFFVR